MGSAVVDALIVLASFVLTECRAVIAFYLSFKSFVALVPEWFFEHVSLSVDDEMVLRKINSTSSEPVHLGEFLKCLTKDFEKMTMTLNPVFTGICISSDSEEGQIDQLNVGDAVPKHLLFSSANFVGLSIVLAFTVILLVELAMFRPHHFGSGRYIAFTIHLRNLLAYKIAAYALAVFNVFVCLSFCYIAYRCYAVAGMTVAVQFLSNFAGTLGGVIYSGIAFALPEKKPHEIFSSEVFKAMVFKRKASEVTKDNLDFCKTLDHAALMAAAVSDNSLLAEYCGTGIDKDGYTTSADVLKLLATTRESSTGYKSVPNA